MKKKTIGSVVALLFVMVLISLPFISSAYVSTFAPDEDRYLSSGRINNDFSYNDLDIQPSSDGACLFRGTITNDSTDLQSSSVTVKAVDASEKLLWQHTFSLHGLSASDSYQFEETVDDCPNPVPYRLKFEISQ